MSQIQPWEERWKEGRIGFHLGAAHPHLVRFGLQSLWKKGSTILVPLCGKSLDMRVLSDSGFKVLGVEAVPSAVDAFFAEAGMVPTMKPLGDGQLYEYQSLQIWLGDVFKFPSAVLPVDGIWDRAALIALDQSHRQAYAEKLLAALKPGGIMLLVSFGYDQARMDGPPYSVEEAEVRALYEPHGKLRAMGTFEAIDGNPRFREAGLTTACEIVWQFRKHE
jgi:thiopurine S-methyltransferase